jgi:hypothetical protein
MLLLLLLLGTVLGGVGIPPGGGGVKLGQQLRTGVIDRDGEVIVGAVEEVVQILVLAGVRRLAIPPKQLAHQPAPFGIWILLHGCRTLSLVS